MGRHLEGTDLPFRTAAERKALVGKAIRYLRHCDIDRSGRGYIFPRYGVVVGAYRTNLEMDNGTTVSRADLVELVAIE
jgi:hypothetical protein